MSTFLELLDLKNTASIRVSTTRQRLDSAKDFRVEALSKPGYDAVHCDALVNSKRDAYIDAVEEYRIAAEEYYLVLYEGVVE